MRPTLPAAFPARTTLASVLAASALASIALTACSPPTEVVELGIERELQRVVGPAESYDVEIEGLRADDGAADRVVAVGERVRPDGAPVIDHIELVLTGVRYDRERERLERIDSARAVATIEAADLARFLERSGSISDADVRFEPPDRAVLRLRPDLGGFPVPPGVTVEVTGRVVGEGSHIRFEVIEVGAAGFSLTGDLVDLVSNAINPLVDLSEVPIALDVTGVRVEAGELQIEAVGEGLSAGL